MPFLCVLGVLFSLLALNLFKRIDFDAKFCSFLNLYNREGVETIGLDDAAARLGTDLNSGLVICFGLSFLRSFFWDNY